MSAGYLSNASCQTSPYKMNEDHTLKNPVEKQSIVSIISSNFNSSNKIGLPIIHNTTSSNISIRRTLSADMSSPKWLQNNGFSQSSVKRVQSSQQLHILGEEDNHVSIENNNDHDKNKGPAFEEIWSSIQADKRSWSSLLSPIKNDGSGSGSGSDSPPPYVHPLTKRSASSLSEKSLEICTESLGSETGSDGFSYTPSEPEDSDKEPEVEQQQQQGKEVEQQEEVEVISYKYNSCSYKGPTSKRSMMVPPSRPSFPPPLPSLAYRDDGSNLHIRSHRQDGRLVVEAVTVPSQNCFRAQRQDGRLLLTLTTNDEEEENENENENDIDHEVGDNGDVAEKEENDEEEEEEETTNMVIEQDNDTLVEEEEDEEYEEEEFELQKGIINVQRSSPTWTMTKLAELTSTRNKSIWPRNYNTTIIKTLNHQGEEEDEEEEVAIKNSIPQKMPRVSTATAAAVVLNAYEYYWRRGNSPTATAVAVLKPLAGQQNNNKTNVYSAAPQVGKDTKKNNKKLLFAAHNTKGVGLAEEEEVVLVKAAAGRGGAKAEYLVPFMLRGCKDHKKSLLFFEPYCIATS